jgi:hypothetical protein
MMADPFSLAPNPVLAGRQPGKAIALNLILAWKSSFGCGWPHNKVPFNPASEAPQDYDMRGFFRALMQGDPKARSAVNENDSQMHYPGFLENAAS